MQRQADEVSVALIGMGGYAFTYLSLLLADTLPRNVHFIAAADPSPRNCVLLPDVQRKIIPVYRSLEELYEHHLPTLTILCTPLHLHADQVVFALNAGSNVLCEKPLCNSPAQAMKMLEARQRSAKQVSIGYQWSFSAAIQELKRDISSGLFGRPKRLSSLVLWPRAETYYTRNGWAGRSHTAGGVPILDSPVNNACAHHLHNMLYVLGDATDQSEMATSVTAELYRANDIETFDTAAVRLHTSDEVELLCTVSHATKFFRGPEFTFEFEHATVTFSGDQPSIDTRDGAPVIARFADGRMKNYGSPERDPDRKLWSAIASARNNIPSVCGIETSLPQTLAVLAIHQSMPDVIEFPRELISIAHEPTGERRWVHGLDEVLIRCSTEGLLPSEQGVSWATAGKKIRLTDRLETLDAPASARRLRNAIHAQSLLPQAILARLITSTQPA